MADLKVVFNEVKIDLIFSPARTAGKKYIRRGRSMTLENLGDALGLMIID